MDLTNGITQMQSQLKPDIFAGYQQGANAYATAEKQGQEIASNRIKNENAKREQEIQLRLQKAIEESYDPSTGQPNYDKLAANGHKYGITAQQMDYTIKHLKENWEAISATAQNKQTTESIAQPGWNTSNPKAPATEQTQVAPQVAPAPPATVAPVKAPEVSESTTKGVAAPTTTEVSPEVQQVLNGPSKNAYSVNGVPQTVQVARPEIAGEPPAPPVEVDPFAPDPTEEEKAKAQSEFDANFSKSSESNPMDLGQQVITAKAPVATQTAPVGHTLYQNLSNMKVNSPYDLGGGAGGVDGAGDNSGVLVAPTNRKGVDVTLNPQEDIEGNTKAWLRNNGYGDADYNKNYNQALNDVTASIMAKMPLVPIRTGDYKKDMEALNAYRNEVQKVKGEALQAKLKLRNEIASQNYTAADNTLKAFTNTIDVDGKTYRGRDSAARATALSLIPVKSEIPQFDTDLKNIDKNDPVGLQMLLARGARLYAGALTPGAQVSEGSLEEVGRQIYGDAGFDWKKTGLQMLAAFKSEGWKGVGKVLASYSQKVDGATIKNRLAEMSHGASKAIDATLKASLIDYKGSGSPVPPPAKEDSIEYTPKTGWFNQPTGTRFKVDPEDPNSLTGMVTESSTNEVTGESKASKVKLEDGTIYNVNEGDPESEDVELTPWNKTSPKGPIKPAKKGGKAPAKPAAKKKVW